MMEDYDNITAAFQAIERGDPMACNYTCCEYAEDEYICFINYNFTEFSNITETAQYEMIIRWCFSVPICLLGVIGNLTIIHILLTNTLLLRTSVNNFILNMSVADLILAVCGPIPFTIRDTNSFWVLGETWCHLEGYIQETVMMVSVCSLTIISFDRMIGVAYPFHQHIKQWQSWLVITLIWIVSAILAVPFSIYRIYTVHVWADLVERLCYETNDMVVWWSVSMIVLNWIPLAIMITCYTIIIVRFRKYDRTVRELVHPNVMKKKKRVIKMMFTVVIVFVVCWGPLQMFTVTKYLFLDDNGRLLPNMEEAYNNFLTISNYMVYLNPALDPIIYALMHENFRRAFRITYSCCFKKQSAVFLSRGTGNRGYMWSTHTRHSSQPNLDRRFSMWSNSIDQSLQEKQTTNRRGLWSCFQRRASDTSTAKPRQPKMSQSIIPAPILEASKESSDHSGAALTTSSAKGIAFVKDLDSDGNNNTVSIVSSSSSMREDFLLTPAGGAADIDQSTTTPNLQ